MKSKLLPIIALLLSFSLCSQITPIPDQNFEQALIDQGIDSDGTLNGQVATTDIDTVTVLNLDHLNISNLSGIEDFIDLEILDCSGNNLQSLNLSNNLSLQELYCYANDLQNLDLSNNLLLQKLHCSVNGLQSLDLSNNVQLQELNCHSNFFQNLDLSNNSQLELLICHSNYIQNLDLSYNPQLQLLHCGDNNLQSLDLSNNLLLEELSCGNASMLPYNQIASLDLSNNPNLSVMWAINMPSLKGINLKNGNNAILTEVNTTCFIEDSPPCGNPLCIAVDDVAAAQNGDAPYGSWNTYAPSTTFSNDCSYFIEDHHRQSLQVYPNPTKGQLNIQNSDELEKINVYDLNGRLIKSIAPQKRIDLSDLDRGLYLLEIKLSSRTVLQKIIKQ